MSKSEDKTATWYREHYFIDVKDATENWTVGVIKALDPKRGLHISYEDNKKPLDFWALKSSTRIAPFRQMSTSTDLTSVTRTGVLDLNEAMRSVQAHLNLSITVTNPMSYIQSYRGHLVYRVLEVLEAVSQGQCDIGAYTNFLKQLFDYGCLVMGRFLQNPRLHFENLKAKDAYLSDMPHAHASCWPELLEVLDKAFTSIGEVNQMHQAIWAQLENIFSANVAALQHKTVPFHMLGYLPIWSFSQVMGRSHGDQYNSVLREVFQKINNLNSDEIRYFDPAALTMIVEKLIPVCQLFADPMEGLKACELLFVQVGCRLVNDQTRLEARIQGLRVLAEAIKRAAPGNFMNIPLDRQEISTYIEQQVLHSILSEVNVEAIKLSQPVLELLLEDNKLTPQHIGELLQQKGHESVVSAVLELMVALAPKLSRQLLDTVTQMWANRGPLSPRTMELMKEFTIKANKTLAGREEPPHHCFLQIFLQLLQRPSDPSKISIEIVSAICQVMRVQLLQPMLEDVLQELIAGMTARSQECLMCCHQILYEMGTASAWNYFNAHADLLHSLVDWLGGCRNLKWKKEPRLCLLKELLSFIAFLGSLSPENRILNRELISQIVGIVQAEEFQQESLDLLCEWLQHISKPGFAYPDELQIVYKTLLTRPSELMLRKCGPVTFNFIRSLFYAANMTLLTFQGDILVSRRGEHLQGLETMQSFAILLEDENIRDQASVFTTQLVLRAEVDLSDSVMKDYIHYYFRCLTEFPPGFAPRIIAILLYLIEAYNSIVNPIEVISVTEPCVIIRYRHQGIPEVHVLRVSADTTFGGVRKAIAGQYPSTGLKFGDAFYTFIYDQFPISQLGYDLYFDVVPIRWYALHDPMTTLRSDLIYLKTLIDRLDSEDKSDLESVWKLFLKLASGDTTAIEKVGGWDTVQAWLHSTLTLKEMKALALIDGAIQAEGGALIIPQSNLPVFQYLLEYCNEKIAEVLNLGNSLAADYYESLLRILTRVDFPDFYEQQESIRILEVMCSLLDGYARAVSVGLARNIDFCSVWQEIVQKWILQKKFSVESTFSNFLGACPIANFVFFKSSHEGFKASFADLILYMTNSISSSPMRNLVAELLPNALNSKVASTAAYFHCLCQVVPGVPDTTNIYRQILRYIKNLKHAEAFEPTLVGCFTVLTHIIGRQQLDVQELTQELTDHCLFPSPTQKYPLCISTSSREAGFLLLSEVSKLPGSLPIVLQQLERFHADRSWRKQSFSSWFASSQEKSGTGYVGLRNLGATCYMNSVLQQLFMLSSFRSQIMNMVIPEQTSVFKEIKTIMLKLRYSQKAFIQAKKLCEAYKNFDGEAINPKEQMDVEEFLVGLFGKMEEDLANSESKMLIKDYFQSILKTEIKGTDPCDHSSGPEEPHYIVPIEVKNMRTMKESLAALVKAEMLEGESAYFCEACGHKVTASKKQLFQSFPKVLIFSLRRFEYSIETGQRKKLNDYFEFEEDLDMNPYTSAYADKLAALSTISETTIAKNMSEDLKYRLKGVVIHIGEAEAGHYISIIREEITNKWVQFNDSQVTEFDYKEMSTMAFGRKEEGGYGQYSQTSAYLLIYEKASNDQLLSLATIRDYHSEEAKVINEKSERFIRMRSVMTPEYRDFVKTLFTGPAVTSATNKERILMFAVSYFITIHARSQNPDVYLMSCIYDSLCSTSSAHLWFLSFVSSVHILKEMLIDCPHTHTKKFIVALIAKCLTNKSDQQSAKFLMRMLQLLPLLQYPITERHSAYFEALHCGTKANLNAAIQLKLSSLLIAHMLRRPFQIPPSEDLMKVSQCGYGNEPLGAVESPNQDSKVHYGFQLGIIFRCLSRLEERDKRELVTPEFMKEALQGAFNKFGALKMSALYLHFLARSETEVLDTYLRCLGQYFVENDYDRYRVALIQLKKLSSITGKNQAFIIARVMEVLTQALENNKGFVIATATLLKFIYKLACSNENVLKWIKVNTQLTRLVESWRADYQKFSMNQSYMKLTKEPQFFQPNLYQVVPNITTIFQAFTEKKFNRTNEGDSDAEVYDCDLGEEAELQVATKALSLHIQMNFGLLYYAEYDTAGERKTEFISADDDRLMQFGTKLGTCE